MYVSMEDFDLKIEAARQQLLDTAREHGMNSEITIDLSRKLDELINEYATNNKAQKVKIHPK